VWGKGERKGNIKTGATKEEGLKNGPSHTESQESRKATWGTNRKTLLKQKKEGGARESPGCGTKKNSKARPQAATRSGRIQNQGLIRDYEGTHTKKKKKAVKKVTATRKKMVSHEKEKRLRRGGGVRDQGGPQ